MNHFKHIFVIGFWGLLTFNLMAATDTNVTADDRGYIVKVGDQIEDLKLTMLDGSIKHLSDFDADVILLNFFASWCTVCRQEIPHIEKEVWQQFKDKRVVVLGVDFKEDGEITNKFIKKKQITYPVALDTAGTIFARFAQSGVTRNVVLDRNLKIIFLTRLFNENEFQLMISRIRQELEKQ